MATQEITLFLSLWNLIVCDIPKSLFDLHSTAQLLTAKTVYSEDYYIVLTVERSMALGRSNSVGTHFSHTTSHVTLCNF